MSLFKRKEEIKKHSIDFSLLRNGSINFYFDQKLLEDDISWLLKNKYEIITFDCLRWKDKDDFYLEFSEKMQFPEKWPATNLDSLNDWMRDIIFVNNGKVLVFMNFESLLQDIDEWLALGLLDIIENHSRESLLYGDKLITLLQTNKPGLHIQGLGATAVKWNQKEWMYKSRGISDKDVEIFEYKR